ncbi:HAMP domain-containing sensor histidine kinase [Sporosarcina thermotolerans]|uniref:histidine kinase n=1 Tax=Sporosarcina thermotolerans TaxID=633404 RepID=A0AAW9AGC9_9BACL|nr:HAMP domain-containing sensor histidine kinase [Sporosarcina thermotolerans]MDW0118218.1 HAMP domain-containing sensor histidine kinase [Sporosarcina thermotolerans]WHT48530.1 HAMP domain-containing sensor histidine kinase [Sporosarcina thermotolerans]
MKNKVLLLTWSALITVVLLASLSFARQGTGLIGNVFSDFNDFSWQLDEFYDIVGPTKLNSIDVEEAKKNITVSDDEIERHRYRYGTLADQLSNIHDQYAQRIADAKDAGNELLMNTLIEERDMKLADIRKNFESDAHVEAKIRKEKEKALVQYLNDVKANSFSLPVAYEFTDVETGETYSSGDVSVPAVYKKQFNAAKGYFKANSLPGHNGTNGWIRTSDYGNQAASEDIQITTSVKTFEGTVIVPKSAVAKGGVLYSQYKDFNKGRLATYVFWLLGIIALITLLTVMKFQKEWVTGTAIADWYADLKIDLKAAAFFMTALILVGYIDSKSSNLSNFFTYQSLGRWGEWLTSFLIGGVVMTTLFAFQLVNGVERWKREGVLAKDIKNSFTLQFFKALREMFLKRSIGVQSFILLIGFFLAGIGFIGGFIDGIFLMIYAFCVLFLGLPALYIFVRRSAYLNRIIVATEQMASGRLNEDIKIEGRSPLADHAKNLNNLREGVRISMTEQAKSERLKTELITNVSHDLRTPLTSIITYTDLLKDENITSEERAKYVDILDKKSQRLKTLIEDLFEVSKMASGNLELNKQRVDLTQLLQQALAEHANQISESGLDFRTTIPEEMLIAHVDGQRWWRVLDNLIVNAVKYSLPGTRVYVTLRKVGDSAEFVVKNITKFELSENVDELFERFKRADTSRHTDGSGLGLAIAQSIVDMHQGNMKIELDGDLFKVTVTVPTK